MLIVTSIIASVLTFIFIRLSFAVIRLRRANHSPMTTVKAETRTAATKNTAISPGSSARPMRSCPATDSS